MFFIVNQSKYLSSTQLKTKTLMNAFYIIKNYPLHASELTLSNFIQQQYKMTLKELCIQLLLKLSFYEDNDGKVILLFKDKKFDTMASLITYGTGAIPGSPILRIALNS